MPIAYQDRTAALLHHPQFERARAVAPEFVDEVLKTIRELSIEGAAHGH
jgi:hypothetical protein